MIARLIFGVAAGATVGGTIGYLMRSAGGTCPMTCNPIGGMITGALFGLVIANSMVTAKPDKDFVASENYIEIESSDQLDRLVAERSIVLIQFHADWCGPCQKLKPTIHYIADEFAGRAAVAGVNIDRNRALASKYGVKSVPDVRLMVAGSEEERFVGVRDKAEYWEAVSKRLLK